MLYPKCTIDWCIDVAAVVHVRDHLLTAWLVTQGGTKKDWWALYAKPYAVSVRAALLKSMGKPPYSSGDER